MTEPNYKELSQELYENLKRVHRLMDDANGAPINQYGVTMSLVDKVIRKYENEVLK